MAEEQPPGTEDPSPTGDANAAADGAATERRTLRRSSTDKVIAGVAGGIGAYFGIDSVIVRIAFILLTFLGGAGPFLYLIGWLALPTEDSPSVIAKALGGGTPNRLRSLLAVALIGLGLLITANLSGDLFDLFVDVWSIAPYLALILIAAGVALVLWPGPAGGSKPTPVRPQVPPAPPPGHAAALLGVRVARADSPRRGRAGVVGRFADRAPATRGRAHVSGETAPRSLMDRLVHRRGPLRLHRRSADAGPPRRDRHRRRRVLRPWRWPSPARGCWHRPSSPRRGA